MSENTAKKIDENEIKNVGVLKSVEDEQSVAKEYGWHRLDGETREIMRPLTGEEKEAEAKIMAESFDQISALKEQKSEFDKRIKGEVEAIENAARQASRNFRSGTTPEEIECAVFLDTDSEERIYVNPETGEILMREDADPDDFQSSMDIEDDNGARYSVDDDEMSMGQMIDLAVAKGYTGDEGVLYADGAADFLREYGSEVSKIEDE